MAGEDVRLMTKSQVVACFVLGSALFGFGAIVSYSGLLGFLHPPGWLTAVAVTCMIVGIPVILGGAMGGLEDLKKQRPPGEC